MSRKNWDEHAAPVNEAGQAEEALRKKKIRRIGLVLGVWLFLAVSVPIVLKYNGWWPARISHLTHRELGPATGKGRRDGLATPQAYPLPAKNVNKTNSTSGTNKDSTQSK